MQQEKHQVNRLLTVIAGTEADTTSTFINAICKRQAAFFGHVMKRENLEHLATTEMIEGKMMRDGLKMWLKEERVTEALKAARDRDAWKVMIAYPKSMEPD